MASADPEIARIAAQIAAHAAISRLDSEGRRRRTAPATEGRWQKYLERVDPDGRMTPADREKAAKAALSADMARLSLIAVKARKERAELLAIGAIAS